MILEKHFILSYHEWETDLIYIFNFSILYFNYLAGWIKSIETANKNRV